MAGQASVGRDIVKGVAFIAGHLGAIVLGLALMILALGLGVGLVTLPAALPVALAGVFLLAWGLIGQTTPAQPAVPPPQAAPPTGPGATP